MVTSRAPLPDAADVRRYARLGRKRVSVGWRRFALELAPSPRPLDAERALRDLPDSPTVLLLCLGNICRSSMGERYLRTQLAPRGVDRVAVESAGFVDTENRPSPDHAVRAAAEYGVDLSDHRSTRVTRQQLDRSDLVLLMDAHNYALLRREFGDRVADAYFLGAFAPGEGWEIRDPYGADVEEFDRVYGQVADAVDGFVARVAEEGER